MDSLGSGQSPVAICCEYDNEPSCSIKDGEFSVSLTTISFSRKTLLHAVSWWVRHLKQYQIMILLLDWF